MFILSACSLLAILAQVLGHGMVLEPVARTSLWREDPTALANYDDNGLFCGGRETQWDKNEGRCGLCGDNWADKRPRASELGGPFDSGKIPRKYKQGANIPIGVMITANHLGYFKFALCPIDVYGSESDECFSAYPLKLADGTDRRPVDSSDVGWFNTTLQLPKDVSCEHCVLQWTYITGNSWGICPDGVGALGCGAVQEYFRTCSDIAISPSRDTNDKELENIPENPELVEIPELVPELEALPKGEDSAYDKLQKIFEDKVAKFVLERS